MASFQTSISLVETALAAASALESDLVIGVCSTNAFTLYLLGLSVVAACQVSGMNEPYSEVFLSLCAVVSLPVQQSYTCGASTQRPKGCNC